MLNPFLQQKLPNIIPMFQKHYVERAYAFGSVVTDRFNDDSDVDLLFDFKEGLAPEVLGEHIWDLWDELEQFFSRKVDLLTSKSLKNPYFIEELNEKKMLIYGKEG